jgi:hypothetical protein
LHNLRINTDNFFLNIIKIQLVTQGRFLFYQTLHSRISQNTFRVL